MNKMQASPGAPFTELSQPIKMNRHLIPVALGIIVSCGAIFVLLVPYHDIREVGSLSLTSVEAQGWAEGLLSWGVLTTAIGMTQWALAVKSHAIAKHSEDPTYVHRSKYQGLHKLKDVASSICTPWGIARLVHHFAGGFVNLSSRNWVSRTLNKNTSYPLPCHQVNRRVELRDAVEDHQEYERISVGMDGLRIDGYVRRDQSTTRWVLITLGAGCFYENFLGRVMDRVAATYGANVVVYNPPGVGSSTGSPSKRNLIKAYKAMFDFVQKGMNSTEIISYGVSLGGVVLDEAHVDLELDEAKQFVLIKDRSPVNLVSAVSAIVEKLGCESNVLNKLAQWSFRYLSGWNMQATRNPLPTLPDRVTEIYLNCGEGLSDDDYREMQSTDDIAESDDLLVRQGTAGYDAFQQLGNNSDPKRKFYVTGGAHNTSVGAFVCNNFCNLLHEHPGADTEVD